MAAKSAKQPPNQSFPELESLGLEEAVMCLSMSEKCYLYDLINSLLNAETVCGITMESPEILESLEEIMVWALEKRPEVLLYVRAILQKCMPHDTQEDDSVHEI